MVRTAESVSPLHPDKICDRISDAILDACLKQDPNSRVAIETMGGHGIITITGELTTNAYVDIPRIARGVANNERLGVQTNIVRQSSAIASGVDIGGAGDQGIMVGYACKETPQLMPLPVMLARQLNQYIFEQHKFDGKTQITLGDHNEIISVVASFQNITQGKLSNLVMEWLIQSGKEIPAVKDIYVNPAGDWALGGFDADTGLTGRKLMVDNYGPNIPIGGGCFSGKDATKVDRSAAYMARKIAVDYLKKMKAKEVYVYLAYAIGVAQPVQATVIVDGNPIHGAIGAFKYDDLGYDLTPKGIIKFLELTKPRFEATANYGHFGNGFKWDK